MSPEIRVPWDWYVVRASALVGFLLLYIAVFAGTVSSLPGIRKYFLRLRSLNFHCWISLQALLFAAIHGFSLLFHQFIPFSLADVFIPFHSKFEPMLVALGTISLYIMIILVLTSYLRRYFSYGVWRSIHFLNIALYGMSIVHAFYLGTDLKTGLLRQIFIWANGFLILLLFINLIYRLRLAMKKENANREVVSENQNENLRQSYASLREERDNQNLRRRI